MISCVIVNFNIYEETAKLVNRIKEYSILDYIVVIDNCSTDDSYSRLIDLVDEKIHVIKSEYNGGYGYGNNIGIKYSNDILHCSKILICNPDVEFESSMLSALVSVMDENPKVAVVSCLPYKSNGIPQKTNFWNIPNPIEYALTTSILYGKLKSLFDKRLINKEQLPNLIEVDAVAGSLLLVDTILMVNYGMFDERMFLYCEETTLAIKFKRNKLKTLVLTDEHYLHHHGLSTSKAITNFYKKKKIWINSKQIVFKDYYELSFFTRIIVNFVLGYTLVESMVASVLFSLINRSQKNQKANK